MSTGFSILPASTSVPLDAAGKGSASFTVTNQTGHPVRARVSVTLLGDPQPSKDWIIPPEITERDLAIDGAQQFTVLVAVPPESPGGTYLFRLDAVSTALPDDEWAHSPEVHFVVPEPEKEPEPEPDKPPPQPKGYIETAAGALLGGLAGGLGVGLVGLVGVVLVAGLPTGPSSGDFFKDLAERIGTVLVLALLAILIAGIALWVGAAIGVFLFLRSRGFLEPARTALPVLVLLPIWAALLLFVLSKLPDMNLPGFVGIILSLGIAAIVILVPALAARAIFRFRTTGRL
jgi:hypothetical protein